MTILDMYNGFRSTSSVVSEAAGIEHINTWGESKISPKPTEKYQ